MIVLGIDPGLAHTGWGIVERRGNVCRTRAYGCIETDATEAADARLGFIFRQLTQVIGDFSPDAVAIEKIFFGQNARSAIATAQARGAALAACSVAGCPVGEYAPSEIKEAVTGIGGADKRQMIFMTRRLLALDHDPRPDHAADALAAAICHAHRSRTLDRVGAGALAGTALRQGGAGGALIPSDADGDVRAGAHGAVRPRAGAA